MCSTCCLISWRLMELLVPQLIDWSNAAGKTALHLACQSGNTELVKVRIQERLCPRRAEIAARLCASWEPTTTSRTYKETPHYISVFRAIRVAVFD